MSAGGNGKDWADSFGLAPRDGDCGDCKWAAMSHKNHVRLIQVERDHGIDHAELRELRDRIANTRDALATENIGHTRSVCALVDEFRDEVSKRLDSIEATLRRIEAKVCV